jgi:hypothetical protein
MEKSLNGLARVLLLGAGGLAAVAGPILFLWPQGTDVYFAWHITHVLTPVFMGANYMVGLGNFLALRENRWSLARVQMPAIIVFALVMLAATLMHTPIFKWSHPIAWAWLFTYIVSPPLAVAVYVYYERYFQPPEPAGPRLPFFTRPLALAIGLADLLLAFGLFFFPAGVGQLWPWTLTPLTARVVAGWLLGSTALLWMAAGQRTLSTAYIALLAQAMIAATLLIGALWHWSSFDGPPLAVVLYLLRAVAVGGWALASWLLAGRQANRAGAIA